jgi:hypothetical protein
LSGEFAGISSSGRTFEIDQVVFAHFRDGLIVEAWEIADIGAMLRQLGVRTSRRRTSGRCARDWYRRGRGK